MIVIACAIVLAACVAGKSAASKPVQPTFSALDNGRSIFQTGRDTAGVQIRAISPPLHNNCAACHRADGSGGLHMPDGAVSADLRRAALVAGQRHPYTLALLERAISTGIDNEGVPLDRAMPRWQLSRGDLHDVALYVQTLK
jgi:cytochrome c oxidase subunit II